MTRTILLTSLLGLTLAAAGAARAAEPPLDGAWVPQAPEVLTYRTTAGGRTGAYTVAVTRSGPNLELLVNMIADGFTKTVWGTLGPDLRPLRSQAVIAIDGKVRFDTRSAYEAGKVRIFTAITPWGRAAEAELAAGGVVVDPSMLPFLARLLPLRAGALFTLDGLDPQRNVLAPVRVEVLGEEAVGAAPCWRVQVDDFDGRAIYWVEKGPRRRPLRIAQPASGRVTELVEAGPAAP